MSKTNTKQKIGGVTIYSLGTRNVWQPPSMHSKARLLLPGAGTRKAVSLNWSKFGGRRRLPDLKKRFQACGACKSTGGVIPKAGNQVMPAYRGGEEVIVPARFSGPASAWGGAGPGAACLRGGGWVGGVLEACEAAQCRAHASRTWRFLTLEDQAAASGWWAAIGWCEVVGLRLGPLTDVKRERERVSQPFRPFHPHPLFYPVLSIWH